MRPNLRARIGEQVEINAGLQAEWQAARDAGRTGGPYTAWLDEEVTQAAAHWILGCVFIRFLEDNDFLDRPYFSGPDERLALARKRAEWEACWEKQRREDAIEANHATRMGDYFASFVIDEARGLGFIPDDLWMWKPTATGRDRGRWGRSRRA